MQIYEFVDYLRILPPILQLLPRLNAGSSPAGHPSAPSRGPLATTWSPGSDRLAPTTWPAATSQQDALPRPPGQQRPASRIPRPGHPATSDQPAGCPAALRLTTALGPGARLPGISRMIVVTIYEKNCPQHMAFGGRERYGNVDNEPISARNPRNHLL